MFSVQFCLFLDEKLNDPRLERRLLAYYRCVCACVSVCLSVRLSVCLSICLSVCLSVSLCLCLCSNGAWYSLLQVFVYAKFVGLCVCMSVCLRVQALLVCVRSMSLYMHAYINACMSVPL